MSAGDSLASSSEAACAVDAVLTHVAGVAQVRRHERGDRRLVLDDEDRVLLRHDGTRLPVRRSFLGGRAPRVMRSASSGSGVQLVRQQPAVGTVDRVDAGVLAGQPRLGVEHDDSAPACGERDAVAA